MSKPRVIKDYDKLPEEVVEQVKLVYPRGFKKYLIPFVNKAGEKKMGLPFETNDYYYLIRMTEEKAVSIIRNDDDYEHGQLKSTVKADYEDKHDDIDFLDEFNANDDNDLGMDDEEIIDPDELPGEENYSEEEEEDIY